MEEDPIGVTVVISVACRRCHHGWTVTDRRKALSCHRCRALIYETGRYFAVDLT